VGGERKPGGTKSFQGDPGRNSDPLRKPGRGRDMDLLAAGTSSRILGKAVPWDERHGGECRGRKAHLRCEENPASSPRGSEGDRQGEPINEDCRIRLRSSKRAPAKTLQQRRTERGLLSSGRVPF